MAKPFMCLLMSEAIEAIVKVKRKNDCNFFKDCAMTMRIVVAFYFLFTCLSHRYSITFHDTYGETEIVCLRIVYEDMKKALAQNP